VVAPPDVNGDGRTDLVLRILPPSTLHLKLPVMATALRRSSNPVVGTGPLGTLPAVDVNLDGKSRPDARQSPATPSSAYFWPMATALSPDQRTFATDLRPRDRSSRPINAGRQARSSPTRQQYRQSFVAGQRQRYLPEPAYLLTPAQSSDSFYAVSMETADFLTWSPPVPATAPSA